MHICGSYDEDIFGKFQRDADGYFFNERLSTEIQKRKSYSESRRNNRTKKDVSNISSSYDKHMENINENIDIDVIEKKIRTKKFVKPDENDVYNLMGELNMKGKNFMSEDRLVNFARTFMDH